jgi:NitT/TauT family transport system ATP-binding protein
MALVNIKDLVKRYQTRSHGSFTAVTNFSLSLSKGEFFCLLGPSGCGKSTVLSILAGFEAPTSGVIELDDRRIDGPSRDRGVVFQGDDSLFPWLTALENIEFGLRVCGMHKRERRLKATKYLNLVGLNGQETKYPTELSGGMKQRIQIARALANEPKMLLMDEPFGALDAQTREVMQNELRHIWKSTNISVFFITHDIDEAIRLGTRVGVMTAGPAANLRDVIDIAAPSALGRGDPKYIESYAQIHSMIRGHALSTEALAKEAA